MNNGFSAKFIGTLLAKQLAKANEHVIIHHITDHPDHIQVELERRTPTSITFERVKMTQYADHLISQFKHWTVKPEPVVEPTIAVWMAGNETLKATVTKNRPMFEAMIKEHNKLKFVGWE